MKRITLKIYTQKVSETNERWRYTDAKVESNRECKTWQWWSGSYVILSILQAPEIEKDMLHMLYNIMMEREREW